MLKLVPKRMQGSVWDEAEKCGIVQILISHEASGIKSFQFAYVEKEDVLHSKIYGKPYGLKFNIVTFDYPSEFLTSLCGVYDYDVLVAIAFGSNKRMYGPFGNTTFGNAPEFKVAKTHTYDRFNYEFGPRSCFAGFHGSVHNLCVNAIGIYIKPITSLGELKPIEPIVELEPEPIESLVELNPTESLAELNIK